MLRSEAKQSLADKLDISLSDITNNDLFTEANLNDYIQTGVNRAWDHRPWSFTERSYDTTSGDYAYYDYPSDFEDESITTIKVDGEEFKKLMFDDYQKFLTDYPDSTDRIWCEHQRYFFINQNAYTSGDTITVVGKLRAPTLSSDSDKLPFSPTTDNQENSGNRAIVDLAYAEALESEKMKQESKAAAKRKDAYALLEEVWKPMGARRSKEQSVARPIFDLPDLFGSNGYSSTFFN